MTYSGSRSQDLNIALVGCDEHTRSALAVPGEVLSFLNFSELSNQIGGHLPALIVAGPESLVADLDDHPELQSIPILVAPRIPAGSNAREIAAAFWRNAQKLLAGPDGTLFHNLMDVGRDTGYRKRFEEERDLMLAILRLVNSPNDTRDLIRSVTAFLREWSGCEAVVIRLGEGDGVSGEFTMAQSIALVPLEFAGRSIGLMQFNDRRKGWFTPETISLFERAAASIATALEQRRAQAALKASEERYRLISENTVDVIWLWDVTSGRFSYVSPSVYSLSGHTSEEMQALSAREILDNEQFSYLAAEMPARAALVESGVPNRIWTDQTDHMHKNGSVVHTEVVTTLLTDENGRVSQVLGVSRDITERRRSERERERLEQQLQQAQKLESVGRLAGGVAHDFNNLLTVINGYGDLALRSLKDGDPVKRHVEEMRRAGEHAAALTSQLLAFSRRQIAEPRVLNLNDVIFESRNMLRHLLGEAIELILHLAPGLGRVTADPGQMHQVLMNLVVNARDAMTGGGRITIRTENCEIDEPAAAGADVKPGSYVAISVSDTGCGMDENVLLKVFEPFFTTKAPGKGGGWVSAKSKPGAGASIQMYLPRIASEPVAAEVADDPEPRKERGTILVVEDQPEVRRLAVIVLGNIGYETIEATGGAEALSVVESHPQEIDLVLTDVVMPRMSGRELADRISHIRPELKVLFMSGYTGDAPGDQTPLDSTSEFLPKPFSPEQLADKVQSILGVNRPR